MTSAGPQSATATQSGTRWVMHMVALKADSERYDRADGADWSGGHGRFHPSRIDLSWSASSDSVGVTGYRVFRNGTEVGTTTTPSFQDVGLNEATTYDYTVSAYDAAGGNNSAQSATASARTLDVTPPTVPANLAAQVVSSTQINLSWSASSDNVGVTGYKLFRGGTLVTTNTVPPTRTPAGPPAPPTPTGYSPGMRPETSRLNPQW